MLIRRVASCLMLLVASVSAAKADFTVTVGDLLLSQGQTGLVPVFISGTAGQTLNNTSFEFRITTTTTGVTRLEFSDSLDPSVDTTFAASNYVFFNNSFVHTLDLYPLGTASKTTVPNDTFKGADSTNNSNDVTVSTNSFLLAYLPVTAITAFSPIVGDTFTISLIAGDNTSFSNSVGGLYGLRSTFGTITIVPEPSAWILGLAGLMALMIILRHRRRAPVGCAT